MEFEASSQEASLQQEDKLSTMKPYKWNSHILGGDSPGGFEPVSAPAIALKNKRKLMVGDRLKMRSDEMHSVFVEKGETASWFIYESAATGSYNGVTYSNHELREWSAKGLYEKPEPEEI